MTRPFLIAVLLVVGHCGPPGRPSDGQMWYGGKPQAPITVAAGYEDTVKVGDENSFDLHVSPSVACTELKTHIYGLDGVEVRQGEIFRHSQCVDSSREVTFSTNVGLGYIAVSVLFSVRGQRYSRTKSFVVRSKGAATVAAKPLGKVVENKRGEKLIIMQKGK